MKAYTPNCETFINNFLPQAKTPWLKASWIYEIYLLKYLCSFTLKRN